MDSSPDARYPSQLRQRLVYRSQSAHHVALRTVLGETGLTGLFLIALMTGLGLLFDFWLTGLHPVFSTGAVLVSVPASFYWVMRKVQGSMNRQPNADYMRNLALATVAGQAGCGTVILIFGALFAGLFLDARLETHPVFTIGLVLLAIPVSLYAMIHLMLTSVAALKPSPAAQADAAVSEEAEDSQSSTKEERS